MQKRLIMISSILLVVILFAGCSALSQDDGEKEEANVETKEESEEKDSLEDEGEDNANDEDELSEIEKIMKEHPYYKELIEKYQTAIQEKWNTEKLDENGMSQEYQDPNSSLPEDYGFELIDINGNGTPELVTGTYIEDHPYVHEIYTIQDDEPVRQFVDGIRTSINIYEDGSIIEGYGDMLTQVFKLDDKGNPTLQEGYEVDAEGYKSLTGDKQSLTEEEANAMMEKYWGETGSIEHSFIPFLSEEAEGGAKERTGDLSEADMKSIMEENYSKLNDILLEGNNIDDLYKQYHSTDEAQQIWEDGIERDSPFYNDMYDLLYPTVQDLVSEEGMESIIYTKYSLYWQPVSITTFFGTEPDLEVLSQDDNRFEIRQTIIAGPQEEGRSAYEYVYDVSYVKEDGEWKFAGAEEKAWDREIKD